MLKQVMRSIWPIVIVGWVVALVRLVLDAIYTEDDKLAWIASVYAVVPGVLLFCALTGFLDHLLWKKFFLGCLALGVLCWGIPNFVTYTVAQFAEWNHGRFFYDNAYNQAVALAKDSGAKDPAATAKEQLGHGDRSRFAEPTESFGGRIFRSGAVAAITSLVGAAWCSLLGGVFIAIGRRARQPGGS